MKKHSLILLSIAFAFTMFSCEKAASLTSASMKATVDGATWTSVTRITRLVTIANTFVITGTSLDGKVMIITIRGDEVGNYTSSINFEDPSAQVGAVWNANSMSYFSKSGTVEITNIDKTNKNISGTFNFELVKADDLVGFSITSGEFTNIKYTESDTGL